MQDKFYVGAKVVCVNDRVINEEMITTVKKGCVYEVLGVRKNPCGCIALHFGECDNTGLDWEQCDNCGKEYAPDSSLWWHEAFRFRLLEPGTELSELSINELLDEILDNDKKAKHG